jgi:hypothetical protein
MVLSLELLDKVLEALNNWVNVLKIVFLQGLELLDC